MIARRGVESGRVRLERHRKTRPVVAVVSSTGRDSLRRLGVASHDLAPSRDVIRYEIYVARGPSGGGRVDVGMIPSRNEPEDRQAAA